MGTPLEFSAAIARVTRDIDSCNNTGPSRGNRSFQVCHRSRPRGVLRNSHQPKPASPITTSSSQP